MLFKYQTYGVPSILKIDNDRDFANKVVTKFMS